MSDFWQGFVAVIIGALVMRLLRRPTPQGGGYQPMRSLDPTNPPQGGSCVPVKGHTRTRGPRPPKPCLSPVTPDPSVQPPPFVEIDRGFE